jgi:hypothetical protein
VARAGPVGSAAIGSQLGEPLDHAAERDVIQRQWNCASQRRTSLPDRIVKARPDARADLLVRERAGERRGLAQVLHLLRVLDQLGTQLIERKGEQVEPALCV